MSPLLPLSRLDEEDHNHGQAVIGYNVYVNGEVKVQTDGALNCQTILSDLEEEQQYCIQVWWVFINSTHLPVMVLLISSNDCLLF